MTLSQRRIAATGQPEQVPLYVKAYFYMARTLWYQRSCTTKPSVRFIRATKGREMPTSSAHPSVVAKSFNTSGDICTPMLYLRMTTSSHEGTNAPFTTIPKHPLEKVTSVEFKGKQYLLVVD